MSKKDELRKQNVLNEQMKQLSAEGNKSTVSRAGGTDGTEPLRSVNEPAPLMSKEDLDLARLKTTKEIKDNQQQIRNDVDASIKAAGSETLDIKKPQTLLTDEQIAEKREEAKLGGYKQYKMTPFNRDAEEAKLSENKTLQDIFNADKEETKAYKERSEKASKYAKAAAWGNMFSALGQIAGLGKNTYVKPDNKYLTSSLAKADEARAMYDKVKTANEKRQAALKKEYLDKAEQQHLANEIRKENAIKAENAFKYQMSKDALNEARSQKWLDFQIQNLLANQDLKSKQLEQKSKEGAANRASKEKIADSSNATKKEIAEAGNKSKEKIAETKGSKKSENRFISQVQGGEKKDEAKDKKKDKTNPKYGW